MQPQIVVENLEGRHNRDLDTSIDRLTAGKAYRDLSTICIIPTRGTIPAKAVQSWLGMMTPMNQKFTRIFAMGMEVGEAYNGMVDAILANPELSTWKYILTLEEDNLPPPDGLLKLYEGMDKFDVIGGLYWTKGEGGQPMIYGNAGSVPKNFIPQIPIAESLNPCNGLGMGFTLFKLEIFKNQNVQKPWFKTKQEYQPGVGASCYTQDLYFFENAAKCGYRFACDTRVKVGHYDIANDIVW
jgi:hypothetical protein